MFTLDGICLLCIKKISAKRSHWCKELLEFTILSCISSTTQSHIHTSKLNKILNDKENIMWMARTRSAREVHALGGTYIDIEPELPDPRRYIAYINKTGMKHIISLKASMYVNIHSASIIIDKAIVNQQKDIAAEKIIASQIELIKPIDKNNGKKQLRKQIKMFQNNVSDLIEKHGFLKKNSLQAYDNTVTIK